VKGLRVAVTRPPREDGSEDPLTAALRAAGAEPVVIPLVTVTGPDDHAPLREAAARVAEYDWLVFTSSNAVRFFQQAWMETGAVAEATSGGIAAPRVAAVGPATAGAAEALLGRPADLVPARYTGSALAEAMEAVASLAGARVLWPRAQEAREELPADLERLGARLDAPVAYRTAGCEEGARQLCHLLAMGALDVVTLASPSAALSLAAAGPLATGALFAAIGPSTAEVALSAGLPVHVIPEQYTVSALVDALAAHLGKQPPE
jgi:uroporphyrinogen III methyltransferase / synthase